MLPEDLIGQSVVDEETGVTFVVAGYEHYRRYVLLYGPGPSSMTHWAVMDDIRRAR